VPEVGAGCAISEASTRKPTNRDQLASDELAIGVAYWRQSLLVGRGTDHCCHSPQSSRRPDRSASGKGQCAMRSPSPAMKLGRGDVVHFEIRRGAPKKAQFTRRSSGVRSVPRKADAMNVTARRAWRGPAYSPTSPPAISALTQSELPLLWRRIADALGYVANPLDRRSSMGGRQLFSATVIYSASPRRSMRDGSSWPDNQARNSGAYTGATWTRALSGLREGYA